MSRTVTVNVQTLLLPLASRATFVTIVTPGGKILPEAGVEVITGLVSQMSDAVTVKVTGVPAGVPHSTTRFAGHMMLGGMVSRTVTVKLQALLLLFASVETHRTVVAPGANKLPDAGEQTSTGLVSQISEVVTT